MLRNYEALRNVEEIIVKKRRNDEHLKNVENTAKHFLCFIHETICLLLMKIER